WLKDMVIVNRFHRNESGVQTVRTLAQFYIIMNILYQNSIKVYGGT
ncbi:hypothetical protein SAMN04489735_10771, partial [Aneurinibacillus thermoaerophilus]